MDVRVTKNARNTKMGLSKIRHFPSMNFLTETLSANIHTYAHLLFLQDIITKNFQDSICFDLKIIEAITHNFL